MTDLKRTAGVEQSPSQVPALPPPYPSDHEPCRCDHCQPTSALAFCQHFYLCFFCRVGESGRYPVEDHLCETGRELIVAMLDELDGRP
jgi:hypothetical protein